MKRLFVLALCVSSAAYARTPAQQKPAKPPTKLPAKKQPAQSAPEAQEEPSSSGGAELEENKPERSQRIRLDAGNTIRLNYGYPEWNKNSTQIDSASLLMREGSSGRIVQVHLEETAPDSSVFSGLYSINWQNLERLQVEFYIPPQALLESTEGVRKISAMIANGELKRKPFILRRSPGGLQTVEVYDTKEQAREAMKAYRAEQQVTTLQNKKYPSDTDLEVANLAADLKEREAAAKSLSERVRLQQVEARRIDDMATKFRKLGPAEQAMRRKAAEDLAAQAMEHYRNNQFPEAQAKFEQAIEADPENHSYFFQYGVTLYRTGNYNRSLVFLNMAEGPAVNPTEKEYYSALDFFLLKEYSNALLHFDKVVASGDPDMAPSSEFYRGVVYYEQKKWEDAKTVFQKVLDTSKDPRLSASAEAYIEQILRLQQFEAERARKWQLSATLGEMYDSNVLLSSDSLRDQGAASNTEGYRTLLMGSARYRAMYEETREFAAQIDFLTMYTVDKNFGSSQALRNTDPTVLTVTAPYTYKGTAFGKGYKFDVVPGYEATWMSIENDETKIILNSALLNLNNLLVMNDRWFANYNLELRSDSANLDSSTGDNDSSAIKVKLVFNNLIFLNDNKSKIMTAEADYTLNQAAGRNSIFNRTDLAVGYIQPFYWGTTANAKLGYFLLDYPQKTTSRTDNSYTLTLAASKPINDTYSAGLLGSYNINNSTDDANQYKKYSVMLTFSALWPF